MRVLVTGARGLLGAAIVREFQGADLHAFAREDLDVSDDTAIDEAVASISPDAIINCAAYNNVDQAERDAETALRVNAFGVLALARAARQSGAALVHYSTDFVFDGTSNRPYVENDRPSPRGAYAASKLLGEWFAADAPRAYVLRVESLFGHPGTGAVRRGSLGTIVDRILAGAEVPVFIDRTVSPSYTEDIARATRAVLEQHLPPGVYHCVNEGYATWAEIAGEAARVLGASWRMKPLTLETAALAAPRPRFCAMSPAKLAAAGVVMPRWEDALTRFLRGGVGASIEL